MRVFCCGHVVLPLLRDAVVPPWVRRTTEAVSGDSPGGGARRACIWRLREREVRRRYPHCQFVTCNRNFLVEQAGKACEARARRR